LHWTWAKSRAAKPSGRSWSSAARAEPCCWQEGVEAEGCLPAQCHRSRGFSAAQREGIIADIPSAWLRKEDAEWEVICFKSIDLSAQSVIEKKAGREVTAARPRVNAACLSNSSGAAGEALCDHRRKECCPRDEKNRAVWCMGTEHSWAEPKHGEVPWVGPLLWPHAVIRGVG